jgi:hypothetical protein
MSKTHTPKIETVVGRLYDYEEVTFATDGEGYWPLTDCCLATGKGSEDGVVCRSCYEEYPSDWGAYFSASDFAEHQSI